MKTIMKSKMLMIEKQMKKMDFLAYQGFDPKRVVSASNMNFQQSFDRFSQDQMNQLIFEWKTELSFYGEVEEIKFYYNEVFIQFTNNDYEMAIKMLLNKKAPIFEQRSYFKGESYTSKIEDVNKLNKPNVVKIQENKLEYINNANTINNNNHNNSNNNHN
eukprot:TRINITY_DN13099_c0_g2_i1.p2 TRINITY_DN13099_c0_g2~~TRINITY_DN13099_c0_g2_i1.p2  ORF type:complete len:160 (-),score=33.54 TRINITY_DN13099_c0_g2_i1:184-663(-)